MADARVLRDLAEEVEEWRAAAVKAERDDKAILGSMYDHNDFAAGYSAGRIGMACEIRDRIRALAADLEGTDAP